LSVAVQLYLGVGVSACPTHLPSALVAHFGSENAARLQQRIQQLLSEAWVEWKTSGKSDSARAAQRVAERFGQSHPELSPDAVRALLWNAAYNSR